RTQELAPATAPTINSGTSYHPYGYVPKPPQNPYGTSTSSRPYSIPTAPQNPYPSSTSSHYGSPTSALYHPPLTAGSAYSPAYSYKCVINQAGDLCTVDTGGPVPVGTACICDRYNGYTQ